MPHIASMGIYVVKASVMKELLLGTYPTANDFGSEIIPGAVAEGKRVQASPHLASRPLTPSLPTFALLTCSAPVSTSHSHLGGILPHFCFLARKFGYAEQHSEAAFSYPSSSCSRGT
jgi:hypothetical protein